MIIIEGPDKIGKSTLQKAILEELNQRGFGHIGCHMNKPPFGFDHAQDYANLISPKTVWDRFHLGELAYRQAANAYGPQTLTVRKIRYVEGVLRQVGAFIIVMAWTDQNLQPWLDRLDPNTDPDPEILIKVNDIYKEIGNRQPVRVPLLDPEVSAEMNERNTCSEHYPIFDAFIGCTEATAPFDSSNPYVKTLVNNYIAYGLLGAATIC